MWGKIVVLTLYGTLRGVLDVWRSESRMGPLACAGEPLCTDHGGWSFQLILAVHGTVGWIATVHSMWVKEAVYGTMGWRATVHDPWVEES